MFDKTSMRRVLLAFDAAMLLAFIAAGVMSASKPGLVEDLVISSGDGVHPVVRECEGTPDPEKLLPGDRLLSVNGIPVHHVFDVEQIVDGLRIGSTCVVTLERMGVRQSQRLILGHYYAATYLVIQYITTLLFFLLGAYVGFQRPQDKPAVLFNILGLTIGGIVMFTAGQYSELPFYLGHLIRGLFPACFLFSAVLLGHFSLEFPRGRKISNTWYKGAYGIVILLSILGLILSVIATTSTDMTIAGYYYLVVSGAKAVLIFGSVFAIGMFVYSHNQSQEIADRIQLKWVLFGTSICIYTYIFHWEVPTFIQHQYALGPPWDSVIKEIRIPEELLLLSVLFAACCMTVALLRFRAFDIEVIIRRSTLYGLVFGVLVLVYAFVLSITWNSLQTVSNNGTTADGQDLRYIAAIIFMFVNLLLFMPARGLIQRMLDRYFYRVRYNYREALSRFSNEIRGCTTEVAIAERMVTTTYSLFNTESHAFIAFEGAASARILAHYNYQECDCVEARKRIERLDYTNRLPLAKASTSEVEAKCIHSDSDLFEFLNVVLLLPLFSEEGYLLGVFILGPKKSRYKYSIEDVDLLRVIMHQVSIEVDRLRIQKELWLEQQEAERLEELSEMKSYYVSSVSHDLKTPLTSIRIFAELLREMCPPEDAQADKYMNIVEGECDRLARLINNVLDYAKMEKGIRHYYFKLYDLNATVRKVIDITGYQVEIAGFTLETIYGDIPYTTDIDEDAVIQALTNVIMNSIKYSGETKYIRIVTGEENGSAHITISDKGIGIATEDLPNIFKPYFRAASSETEQRSGAGLGLALVRHTVEAHGGSIDIESELGEGTKITLYFPLKVTHETNTDN